MSQIAQEFVLFGGKLLCFDDIHKYDNWSAELKNIYDQFPQLKLIATGSSALSIKDSHDLNHQAVVHHMVGVSFREFLQSQHGYQFEAFSLEEVLSSHIEITELLKAIIEQHGQNILPLFKAYLKCGYYPYSLSMPNETLFFQALQHNINTSIESDLLNIYPKLNGSSIKKIKMLLAVIVKNAPFKPKMSTLKKAIEIKDDRTLKDYLAKLDDVGLIKLLMQNASSVKAVDKPEKIFLANPNLMYTKKTNASNLRETFFINQLDNYYKNNNAFNDAGIVVRKQGDFFCQEKYTFAVGESNKDFQQIKGIENAFVVSDELEIGCEDKVPLWLFGFLY